MRTTFSSLLAVAFLFACGDDGSGGGGGGNGTDRAYLTIEGEDDLFGDPGQIVELVVRYHDVNDQPLAGTVSFSFFGDPAGSTLSRTEAQTGIDGRARVQLRYSDGGDVAFQVMAEALKANSANWRVAIGPRALDVLGTYRVDSSFVLPEGLPAGEADRLMTFTEMTNDPHDPATWLLDRLQGELDADLAEFMAIVRSGGVLDSMVNTLILENSPDAVSDLRALGDGTDQLVRSLNPVTQMDVTGTGADDVAPTGTHRLTGAVFVVNGGRHEYTAEQMELGAMTSVAITLARPSERKLSVSRHTLRVPYGRLLQYGLDKVVVPSIDPSAGNVTQLVANMVDCVAIGARLAEEIGFGSPAMYQAACVVAVDAGVGELTGDLRGIEADLDISGGADLTDADQNHVVERFSGGLWEGTLVFSSGSVALPRPNQLFTATRLFGPTN